MTPADFKLPVIEEAYRLRRSTVAWSRTHELDERTSMWVIRMEAWRELMQTRDFFNYVQIANGKRRNELLGLPVRLTINDDPDTPMIQLVMEPMMSPRQ